MGNLFSDGGPFQFVITAFGLAALVFCILQIVKRGQKDYTALIVGMIAATFMVSVLAYSMGMYQAGRAIATKAEGYAKLAALAEGIACTVLVWGSILCTVNAVVGSIACHLHRQAKAD